MNELEKIFDGAYSYLENDVPYSQENFQVYKNVEKNFLVYKAEILTRVPSGEFLKINCHYEVNTFWAPQKVIIEKTLGESFAIETFTPDHDNQVLVYDFTNNGGTQTYSRNIVTRYQITTPAISTSMLCSQTKKFDSLSRNAYILVSASNGWEYEKPFVDKSVFIEYKTHENTEIKVNGTTLTCTKCVMYQNDSHHHSSELPSTFYLSKHLGIPYKIESDKIKIEIKYLNKMKSVDLDDFFKPHK